MSVLFASVSARQDFIGEVAEAPFDTDFFWADQLGEAPFPADGGNVDALIFDDDIGGALPFDGGNPDALIFDEDVGGADEWWESETWQGALTDGNDFGDAMIQPSDDEILGVDGGDALWDGNDFGEAMIQPSDDEILGVDGGDAWEGEDIGDLMSPDGFEFEDGDEGDAMFDGFADLGERLFFNEEGGEALTDADVGELSIMPGDVLKRYTIRNFKDNSHDNWETKLVISNVDYLSGYKAYVKNYHDQGWGHQKSRMRVALYGSNGKLKSTDDLFGLAPHRDVSGGITAQHEQKLVSAWTMGDKLKVEAYVGGGGGHSLTVGGFRIDIKKSPYKRKRLSVRDFTDKTHANWETKLTVKGLKNLKGYKAYVQNYHDQGWGFRKSQVRVALLDKFGAVKTTDDLFGIAPHRDVRGGIAAIAEPQIPFQFVQGDKLVVQSYVGGGGGHSLTVGGFKFTVDDGVVNKKKYTIRGFTDNTHANYETKLSITLPRSKIVGYKAYAHTFHDQGFSFFGAKIRKSRVRLALFNKAGRFVDADDLFGLAPHKDAAGSVRAYHDTDFMDKLVPGTGQKLAVQSVVGGGGGHSLTLKGFQIELFIGL